MRSLLLAVPALTLLAYPWVQAQPDAALDRDLAGVYACQGTRPDGVVYKAAVQIVRHEGTYQLLWTLPTGDQYLGIGIANHDSLAVSYFGELPGVILYKIEQDGGQPRLVGAWTVLGANGQVFSETLTRLKTDPQGPSAAEPPNDGARTPRPPSGRGRVVM